MRHLSLRLVFVGAVLIIATGCATSPNNFADDNPPIVHALPGQTVKQVVDSLPPAGGTVALGPGTWVSGYDIDFISKRNVTIQGSGIPNYNSAFTAMSGGTIVLGRLAASTGADHFTVRDLGVDAGQEYINANNGGVPTDALAIYNAGQVVGAPQVESPVIENVSCLGYSPTAPAHCMLVENVNHAYVHDVIAVKNCHGLVLKGTNSTVDGVFSRGHSITSVIVKSDNYAPASQDNLSNISIVPLVTPGDTRGISIIGVAAPLSDISISKARIESPLSWGIHIEGASAATPAFDLNLSDIFVNYWGNSPAGEYCVQFIQYVRTVHINNLNCSDMWVGLAPYLPAPGSFGGVSVTGSQFTNIATNAIETYGDWNISNASFASIAGNGIVNPSGVTAVYGNTFTDIGGSNMLSTGGTFVVQSSPY